MMSIKPQLRLSFLGSSTPFICFKIKATKPQTFARIVIEAMSNMVGTIQMYYIDGLPVPLSKKNMTISIFLTVLVSKFKPHKVNDEDEEMWIFLGDRSNVKCGSIVREKGTGTRMDYIYSPDTGNET